MKKTGFGILALLLSVLCCLSGCGKEKSPLPIQTGDSMEDALNWTREASLGYESIFGSVILGRAEEYLFYIGCDWQRQDRITVEQIAVFSLNRELVYASGLEVVPHEAFLTQEVPTTLEEVESRFGPYHFDRGSGLFIPAYVTDRGAIAFLALGEENQVSLIYDDTILQLVTGTADGLLGSIGQDIR